MLAVVNQILIGLVGHHHDVALDGEGRNFFGLGSGENHAAGILGRVVVDGAGLGRGKLLQGLADSVAARGDGGQQ